MNIQFMTAERNGIPTGEKNWNGEPKYKYIPDYDDMIANASCKEEAEAINEARKTMERFGEGFAFEIVYTAIAPHVDFYTGERSDRWEVLQHPWYRTENGYYSKESMIKDIEEMMASR